MKGKMRMIKCKFEFDRWGLYITPLIGFDWNPGKKRLWVGWLFWLFVIDLKA